MKKLSFLLTLLIVFFACHTPLIVGIEPRSVPMESRLVAPPEPSSLLSSSSSSSLLHSDSCGGLASSSSSSSLEDKDSENSDHKALVDVLNYYIEGNDLPMIRVYLNEKNSPWPAQWSADELAKLIKYAAQLGYFNIVKHIIDFAREKVPARLTSSFYMITLGDLLIAANEKKRIDVVNLIISEFNAVREWLNSKGLL